MSRRFWLSFLAILFVAAGCEKRGDARKPDSPRLVCEEPRIDLRDVFKPHVGHVFRVTNESLKPLRISKIAKSCSCTTVGIQHAQLRPGESTEIGLNIDVTGRHPSDLRRFDEELLVLVDDETTPTLTLRVVGRYIPCAYKLSNQVVLWAPRYSGESFEGCFDVFVNSREGIKVKQVTLDVPFSCDHKLASSEPVPGTDFVKHSVLIHGVLAEGAELPSYGRLIVTTNRADAPQIDAQVVLQKEAEERIVFSPRVLAFGLIEPGSGPISRSIEFRIPADFEHRIDAMKIDAEGVSAAKGASPNDDTLVVQCTVDPRLVKRRAIQTELLVSIVSSSATHELRIPVSGFVRDESPTADLGSH